MVNRKVFFWLGCCWYIGDLIVCLDETILFLFWIKDISFFLLFECIEVIDIGELNLLLILILFLLLIFVVVILLFCLGEFELYRILFRLFFFKIFFDLLFVDILIGVWFFVLDWVGECDEWGVGGLKFFGDSFGFSLLFLGNLFCEFICLGVCMDIGDLNKFKFEEFSFCVLLVGDFDFMFIFFIKIFNG